MVFVDFSVIFLLHAYFSNIFINLSNKIPFLPKIICKNDICFIFRRVWKFQHNNVNILKKRFYSLNFNNIFNTTEIRITVANKCYFGINNAFKSKQVSHKNHII